MTLPLVTAPADAAYPGRNGRVAVEINKQTFTLSATGTGRVNLGPGTGPRCSPDGRKLAYAYNNAIWVMNPNGTGRVRVTPTSARAVNPTWSPDGKRIAFSGATSSSFTTRSLYAVTLATRSIRKLTSANDRCAFDPTWAKTGRHVVYSDQCAAGGYAVKKIDTVTGAVTPVIPASGVTGNGYHLVYDGRRPDVSPDGSKVLSAWADYATDDAGLATTNLSGGSLRIIADGVLGGWSGDPVFSPDGKQAISGSGWENSQIESFCVTTGCLNLFYYGVPDDSQWVTSLDWQPLP